MHLLNLASFESRINWISYLLNLASFEYRIFWISHHLVLASFESRINWISYLFNLAFLESCTFWNEISKYVNSWNFVNLARFWDLRDLRDFQICEIFSKCARFPLIYLHGENFEASCQGWIFPWWIFAFWQECQFFWPQLFK